MEKRASPGEDFSQQSTEEVFRGKREGMTEGEICGNYKKKRRKMLREPTRQTRGVAKGVGCDGVPRPPKGRDTKVLP